MGDLKQKLMQHKAKQGDGQRIGSVAEMLDGGGQNDESILHVKELAKAEGRYITLSADLFSPDPEQPRRYFDEDKLKSLQASIEEVGQLQPIYVKPANEDGIHVIIFGERRWRAITASSSIETIEAIVCNDDLDEYRVFLAQFHENDQSEPLTPIETALATQRAVNYGKALGINQSATAKALGIERAIVTKHLKIVNAPDAIRDLGAPGRIGDVESLYALATAWSKNPTETKKLITKIENGKSVTNLRQVCRKLSQDDDKGGNKNTNERKPPVIKPILVEKVSFDDGDEGRLINFVSGDRRYSYIIPASILDIIKKEL